MEAATSPQIECCMCGDYGLLNQLFQCKVCLFRSQHRYCSNLFHQTTSIQVCNWCLKKDQDSTEAGATITSSTSSSSSSGNNIRHEADQDNKGNPMLQFKKPMKSSSDKLVEIRMKDIKKQLFKGGKVRKYKLLEDVCG